MLSGEARGGSISAAGRVGLDGDKTLEARLQTPTRLIPRWKRRLRLSAGVVKVGCLAGKWE